MVKLIKNKQGEAVGWELSPTTPEDHKIAAIIRDLQFFGLNGSAIEYKGLELINPEKGKVLGNIKCLKWAQKQHIKGM